MTDDQKIIMVLGLGGAKEVIVLDFDIFVWNLIFVIYYDQVCKQIKNTRSLKPKHPPKPHTPLSYFRPKNTFLTLN